MNRAAVVRCWAAAALVLSSYAAVQAAGNLTDGPDADLLYDWQKGRVILDPRDPASGAIVSFALVRNVGEADFLSDGAHLPFPDTGQNTDLTPAQIGQTDYSGTGFGEPFDLGRVFPSGLDSGERLQAYLETALYASEFGQGGSFDLRVHATGDVDADGLIDATDIDLVCAGQGTGSPLVDLTEDGSVDQSDLDLLVTEILGTDFGDADLNGRFDSGDFIHVFQAGQYEDLVLGNSTWATGDWNCDREFSSSDLVFVFQRGGYVFAARQVPEPCGGWLALAAALLTPRRLARIRSEHR